MPTYNFKCDECNITVEEVVSVGDNSDVLCGNCGSKMKKIFTACNFILKGGGWAKDLTEKNERTKHAEKQKEKLKDKKGYNDVHS